MKTRATAGGGGQVSAAERMIVELRDAEPMTRALKLADIAKTYGDGFAEQLRRQIGDAIEADAEKRRHRRGGRRR